MHCYKVLQSSVFSRPQFVRGIGCDECWVGLRLEQVNSRDDRNPPRPPPTPCPARWVLNRRPFACKAEPLTLRLRELGEDILDLYRDIQGSFQYYLIVKSMRRKIKGEANDILISNNTPTEWTPIKEVLCLYYADKRDLMTLDTQLKTMSRGPHETIEFFYSRVREMITLICSAIQTDTRWEDGRMAIIRLYNMMALDTFIRGLGEPLSLFCKNYKPNNLAQAYHYCVELKNLT